MVWRCVQIKIVSAAPCIHTFLATQLAVEGWPFDDLRGFTYYYFSEDIQNIRRLVPYSKSHQHRH